ncbi:MAG TPA: glycosyltransferase family 4 protein [Bacteroidia bacterium]|jgi:glycosyltransferase involved in cell wall biosynthesis|nr:glycosyltransferase family 4 protein [Bacteroidia bacterium]
MPKILFIASHRPNRSPSQRFRYEQYTGFLQAHGFEFTSSPLISKKDDQWLYKPGNLVRKSFFLLKCYYLRWKDLKRIQEFDIIFIQREAFLTGSYYFERQYKKSGARIVFDFDDAIWHLNMSEANRKLGWLKNPDKTAKIIGFSDLVIAGNRYLEQYALRFNTRVIRIPTTIDTLKFLPVPDKTDHQPLCIGWSGSLTTIRHFQDAIPFLKLLKEKYGNAICFKVIGDVQYSNQELSIQGIAWKAETEVEDLSGIDIGIMPLPDDEWAKGKCGLKGLSYMSLGIPTVMSPVGVNTEIIHDGVNGFLAGTTGEWVQKLSLLIESPTLRKNLGQAGRQTVEDQYSVESQKNNYLQALRNLIN